MKIAITGSNGYIAKKIMTHPEAVKHEFITVKRELLFDKTNKLTELLSRADGVIHLAGAPILQRWSVRKKEEIYNSRVESTRNISEAILNLPAAKRPSFFIGASAIGIYADNLMHDENSQLFNTGFAGTVVKDWENSSLYLDSVLRRVIFRIGLVIGQDAPTIQKLRLPFALGLGGKIGSGRQAFPFIHISDLVRAFFQAIENTNFQGIYNLVAPEQITNLDFTRQLATSMKRPAFLTVPAFSLRIIYGNAAQLITNSPQVLPQRLLTQNFTWQYGTIQEALADSIKK